MWIFRVRDYFEWPGVSCSMLLASVIFKNLKNYAIQSKHHFSRNAIYLEHFIF